MQNAPEAAAPRSLPHYVPPYGYLPLSTRKRAAPDWIIDSQEISRIVSKPDQPRRYRVYLVGTVYAVLAWLAGQLLMTFSATLQLDEATVDLIIVALVLGFIPVVILTWMFARYRARRSRNRARGD